jgi:two-component system OmpR family response regulator
VLIVEDDKTLLSVLGYNFTKEGYSVLTAEDGVTALELARSKQPDLIVLDIMLPQLDGLEVCRILRREMNVPILMLTAKVEEVDRIVGLELGADDYVTKPFGMRELLARVKALLRRTRTGQQAATDAVASRTSFRIADLEVDTGARKASRAGTPIYLNRTEFDLLVFLMRNRGIVFSRDQILDQVWGFDFEGDARTVDVHVRWLRQKIEADPGNPRHLLTVRGVGYKFEA